jgi:hypothetical protein
MRKLLAVGSLAFAMGSASATTWMIGDNDGYGIGIPDNADHPFQRLDRQLRRPQRRRGGRHQRRAVQPTPTAPPTRATRRTATKPSRHSASPAWQRLDRRARKWFDRPTFQASDLRRPFAVTYNGIVQNWPSTTASRTPPCASSTCSQDVMTRST